MTRPPAMRPAPPPSPLHWRGLAAAAAVCLSLGLTLVLTAGLHCAVGLRHNDLAGCDLDGKLGASLGMALLLWLGAALTQRWLPAGGQARRWGRRYRSAGCGC